MTNERLLHEWVELGCRVRVILEDVSEDYDGYDSRVGRALESLESLLSATPEPTKEQVLQWEAERLSERKAKENV